MASICMLAGCLLPVKWFWLWPPVWAREGTCWWFWWGRTRWCLRSLACGTLPHSDRQWGWWGPPLSWSSSLKVSTKQIVWSKCIQHINDVLMKTIHIFSLKIHCRLWEQQINKSQHKVQFTWCLKTSRFELASSFK